MFSIWRCYIIKYTMISFIIPAGRELATLHHICVSHSQELHELSNILSIKKLVTVTDMLTKHKLKYREMIS